MPIAINMTSRQADVFLKELQTLPFKRSRRLLERIGTYARDETRRRVRAGGGVPPSKWIRARKGVNQALVGMDRRVELFMLGDGKAIVESIDPRYTLYQHAKGYTKPAGSGGVEDRVFEDWVVIPLKDTSPLEPTTNPFIYNWKLHRRPSRVPARDILPTDEQMANNGNAISQKWAQEILSEALAKVGL